ncbi:aldo/keto reductase [Arthrobacter mangrovi]|uniref:Oxidoreductase n=1 Tax=Arthrobacter mangrovi TaxID=2966350 RepID=A0ABQ5MYK3_9MICC|nr:aldo/keto reductase [Arthrobacter mangrovi]GLB69080.1 oxidoreductase [Arthrobacter mangrovi]
MDDGGSRLIFGCMGLGGGWGSGPLEAAHVKAAHDAVEAALDAGIRDFDHADIYAHGKAEEAFGRVLAERPGLRERIRLQTKCGIRLPSPERAGQYDSSREWILAQTEESLRRLGTGHVETLLIHRPDPLAHPGEIAEAFLELRDAGKVGRLGVSNMSAEQMRWLQSALPEQLAANQLEMSLHRTGWLESGVLVNHPEAAEVGFPHGTVEYCQTAGVELQAWGALAQGRYSGAAGTAETGPDAAAAALVGELAERKGCAPEAVVLGWLLRHPAGIRPVVGTSNPARIRASGDAERIAAGMDRHEWYSLWVAARGRALP